MTTLERQRWFRLEDTAAVSCMVLVIGVWLIGCAAAVHADTLATATHAVGTLDRAIEVAAGKSVLWLALAGTVMMGTAVIALIVVMFKVFTRGITALENLKDSLERRPCAYLHHRHERELEGRP